MSQSYHLQHPQALHFITIRVVAWIDVFTRSAYRDIFIESLNFCIEQKELQVHAWVLMTNHAHLMVSSRGRPLYETIRDFKQFTAKRIMKAIAENPQESRTWMMRFFEYRGKRNPDNDKLQFWENGYHPIHCYSDWVIKQKIDYIHNNPVRAGLVNHDYEWPYSSAAIVLPQHALVRLTPL